jgi:glycosyltransferase involved in cell wall biosynthesis
MKKILIISYFFPPCNLTASQRVLGWAKYLNKFGYYPIIVTRNWDLPINKPEDTSYPIGKEIVFKKEQGYEVYYLPYKGNLKDRIYSKYGSSKLVVFRKFFSLIELVGQNISNVFNPFSNFYVLSKQIIQKENVTSIIISGNPFIQFRFGYLLNKKFEIPWLADYRDDWSTDELNTNKNFMNRIISRIDSNFEKKWVVTASHITSVSPYYVEKISKYTKVDGSVIYNGFFVDDFPQVHPTVYFDNFTLCYNGTLYPSQNIELFIEGFKLALLEVRKLGKSISLYFPGLRYKPDQAQRVVTLLKGYEDCYLITDRLPRVEVLEIQLKSHVMLMFPHTGIKGIPSSKLYEYLGLNKFILICPSDDDILEQTIQETGNGIICRSVEEVKSFIIDAATNTHKLSSQLDFNKNMIYSRENQTKALAAILNKIT